MSTFREYRSIPNPICPKSGKQDDLTLYLRDISWVFHEKIDGMGMRIIWTREERFITGRTSVSAPSDAEIEAMEAIAPSHDRLTEVFGRKFKEVIIFGELFGEKIQKNPLGMLGKHFRVFDILLNDEKWASMAAKTSIAADLGLEEAQIIMRGNLASAVAAVSSGVNSIISPSLIAEGLIGRPSHEIFDKRGNLILCKIKTKYYM